jgi:hypothetical protein
VHCSGCSGSGCSAVYVVGAGIRGIRGPNPFTEPPGHILLVIE